MAVIKVYTRINWLNKSESLTTPLGKTNLNKMDKAINLIDDEVVSMSAKIDEIDTTKVSADQLNNMVTDVSFNDKNGVISITKHNGTVLNIDTAMEKIAVNFEYNAQTQQLILTLENGEKQYIDMSALITQYEFKDTDTIAFSVDSDGKVSASIKSGSITKAMLSSEIMSAITLSENNAAASAQTAAQSATNADMDAKLSQSYSVGKSGIRDGEDTDNSKYYSEQAKKYADEAQEIAGGNFIPNSEKGIAGGVAVLNANLAVEKAVGDEDGNNIKNTYAKKTDVANTYAKKTDIPKSLPANGGNADTVNGHTVNSDVPANAKFTDTTYSDATTSAHGLMSASDKSKLNGIAAGANKTTILNSLAATTTGYALDAIQGKALNDKITAINDSLANINILYKYDDATLICKQGHVITIYFDCLSVGFERLQDYLTKHTEYCPFKPVLVMVPVWFINETAKYVGYVRITEQGLIYIRYMVASYPNTFTNIASNMGMSGSISYVV